MQLKQKIKKIFKTNNKTTFMIRIVVLFVVIYAIVCTVVFLQVKSVYFSYGKDSCVQQISFLPKLSKITDSDTGFSFDNRNVIKIGSLELFSTKTCFIVKKLPSSGEIKLSIAPNGGWLARKTYKLIVSSPPVVRVAKLVQPIATMKPLVINLNTPDSVFDYQLDVDDKSIQCPVKDSEIHCDIKSLNLLNEKNMTLNYCACLGIKQ